MGRLVFGIQPVREAIRVHGARIERVSVARQGGPKLEALARWATDQGVAVETIDNADLDRRTGGGRHQGVVAVVPELRLWSLDELKVDEQSIFVALDGVMDPQNFGAVVRSVVALGANAVIWPEHSSAPLSPATFRASAGAIEHAVLCRVASLAHAFEHFAARGVLVVALDAQAPVELSAVDLKGPVLVVIGAEDKGVRRGLRRACKVIAHLPMAGPIGSLNASVAGAIALYEVIRQRASARTTAAS
jgi:23S rRNA (guanosine2251-2'-O)-methyltransferase